MVRKEPRHRLQSSVWTTHQRVTGYISTVRPQECVPLPFCRLSLWTWTNLIQQTYYLPQVLHLKFPIKSSSSYIVVSYFCCTHCPYIRAHSDRSFLATTTIPPLIGFGPHIIPQKYFGFGPTQAQPHYGFDATQDNPIGFWSSRCPINTL